ncbi:MAG: hypothetical protein OEV43_04820 [Coriobacteriia bacterium]|nr:hypothetical protein [Coriobacteriia bacterium]
MAGRRRRPLIAAIVAVIVIVVALVIVGLALFLGGEPEPGDTQDEVIQVFGAPSLFTIQYIPRDESPEAELVRTEIWYYPDHEQQLTFIEGLAVAVEPIQQAGLPVAQDPLDPRYFDADTTAAQIADILGEEIERVDDVLDPDAGDEAEGAVYVSESALFAIQDGVLLYFETIGVPLEEEGE